jgi:hypothetical protein
MAVTTLAGLNFKQRNIVIAREATMAARDNHSCHRPA